jgi:hypothetical protein
MSEDRPQYQAERDTVPTPLPKNARCHRCGEWFANAHVCADQIKLASIGIFDPIPTPAEIVDRLRQMSSDMMVLGTDMQYTGGFGKIAELGTAMHIGASNLRTWAEEIEEAQG